MRVTIDLPDELSDEIRALASETSRSLGETVGDLIRRGLALEGHVVVTRSELTGLPVVDLGRTITMEDVKALEDED